MANHHVPFQHDHELGVDPPSSQLQMFIELASALSHAASHLSSPQKGENPHSFTGKWENLRYFSIAKAQEDSRIIFGVAIL